MATLQDLKRGLIDAHQMGDTVRARQLAMSIRLMEAPAMDAVPVAGQFGVQSRRRPLTMGERATEFSAGAGKAYGQAVRDITQQAERFGERYMEAVQDPRTGRIPFAPLAMAGYGAVQDIAAGIEPIVRNPAILGEMATGMAQQAVSGPQGAGEVFGSLVSPTQLGKAFRGPVMQEMTTYHGTPHVFAPEEGAPLGRFRASQIGTGEGAQAYGHGIYVAENPTVAGQYLMPNMTRGFTNRDSVPEFMRKAFAQASGKRDDAIKILQDELSRTKGETKAANLRLAIRAFEKGESPTRGSLYTVDLPDPMVERMLDWDKPLSEQPESVRKAFETAMRDAGVQSYKTPEGTRVYLEVGSEDALRGRDVYRRLMDDSREGAIMSGRNADTTLAASQAAASDYLRSLGVPGIRYFDAGSRDSAKGTRNFVIFPGEEQNLTILQRE